MVSGSPETRFFVLNYKFGKLKLKTEQKMNLGRLWKPFRGTGSRFFTTTSAANVEKCDVFVIGAGIAGTSVSYELCNQSINKSKIPKIILCEQEHEPGYHTTGRAAGIFSENYGTQAVKCLSFVSREWLECPPIECQTADFDSNPILTRMYVMVPIYI